MKVGVSNPSGGRSGQMREVQSARSSNFPMRMKSHPAPCVSEDDYFVLKPKHSGFFNTTLDLLLEYLQVEALVITGFRVMVTVNKP